MRLNELEQLEKQKRWQRAANLYTQDKLMILLQAPASSPHTINISVLAPWSCISFQRGTVRWLWASSFYSELRNICGRNTPASKRVAFALSLSDFRRFPEWHFGSSEIIADGLSKVSVVPCRASVNCSRDEY